MDLTIVLVCLVMTSACALAYFRLREDLNITMSTNNTMGNEIVRLNKCLDGSERVNNHLAQEIAERERDLAEAKRMVESRDITIEMNKRHLKFYKKQIRTRNKKGQFK